MRERREQREQRQWKPQSQGLTAWNRKLQICRYNNGQYPRIHRIAANAKLISLVFLAASSLTLAQGEPLDPDGTA